MSLKEVIKPYTTFLWRYSGGCNLALSFERLKQHPSMNYDVGASVR